MGSSGRWFFVDGKLTEMHGDHEDVVDQTRELRADGHTVNAARAPRGISSRDLAASQHRKGGSYRTGNGRSSR